MMIEIEKKYRVLDRGQIEAFLKPLTSVSTGHLVDMYYDTPEGSYYQRGIFIRTRNNKTLDIKFNPEHLKGDKGKDHVVCSEYNFEIPLRSCSTQLFQDLVEMIGIKQPSVCSLEAFFLENDLAPLVTIDKSRKTYQNERCMIALDELDGFGAFIEFEAIDGTQNVQDFIEYVNELTNGLSLEPIASGYVEFALRQTNEALYKKGKYLLEAA